MIDKTNATGKNAPNAERLGGETPVILNDNHARRATPRHRRGQCAGRAAFRQSAAGGQFVTRQSQFLSLRRAIGGGQYADDRGSDQRQRLNHKLSQAILVLRKTGSHSRSPRSAGRRAGFPSASGGQIGPMRDTTNAKREPAVVIL